MPGIIFHYFHNEEKYIKCQGSLDSDAFSSLICYLMKKYTILNMDEYIKKAIAGNLNETEICLTFDDGIRSQYEIAVPVLSEFGIRAGFFIYTEPFCGRMSQLEIDHDFRFLHYENIDCFYSEFFDQLRRSHNIITRDIQKKIDCFSYNDYKPECTWHSYNDKLFRYVRSILLKEQEYRQIMDSLMTRHNYKPEDRIDCLWMTENEIRQLVDMGHTIGLHSHTHPTDIRQMSYESKRKEYAQNMAVLESITNISPVAAAYPCGNRDEETQKILQILGIKIAFLAKNEPSQNIYALSRINHTELLKEMNR